ncbi:MAG: hypothetical protein E7265_04895 [Lachnospiraceae bacterium]|nr:hypothetical protein [Lachnospiraceae bacterium]
MANTKIVVIRMKEIIYTALFATTCIVLIILLVLLFKPSSDSETANSSENETAALYNAGVYNTQLSLNNTTLNLELVVDSDRIKSVRLVNLDVAVTTMFPLLEPALKEIEAALITEQNIDNIEISESSRYTQMLLIDAISRTLDKAKTGETTEQTNQNP